MMHSYYTTLRILLYTHWERIVTITYCSIPTIWTVNLTANLKYFLDSQFQETAAREELL